MYLQFISRYHAHHHSFAADSFIVYFVMYSLVYTIAFIIVVSIPDIVTWVKFKNEERKKNSQDAQKVL